MRTGAPSTTPTCTGLPSTTYLLVVNAANREKDWVHLASFADRFPDMEMIDRTMDMAMLSLQGPASKMILDGIHPGAPLPDPMRNHLSIARSGDAGNMDRQDRVHR